MKDVILYIPPISFVAYPLLGVPLLTSFLSKEGYQIKVEDMNMKYFIKFEEELKRKLKRENLSPIELYKKEEKLYLSHILDSYDEKPSTQADKKFIASQKYEDAKLHGLSVLSGTSYNYALEISKEIKKQNPNSLVILGGNYFFDVDRTIDTLMKNPSIDAICIGEGEYTLLELLHQLERSNPTFEVNGTIVRRGEKIIVNKPRKPIDDLDSLPFADFSQLPLEEYLNFRIGTPVLPLSDSRGCPFHCSFCNENYLWGKYRSRSPKKIADEMKYQVEKHKAKIFRFCGSVINVNPNNLEKLSEAIIEENLDVMWGGYARIDERLNCSLLNKMYKAGCRFLAYGIESASPRLLKIMKKEIDLNVAAKNLRETKKSGISTVTFWLTNFPGEREEDIKLTEKFLYENKDYIDVAFFSEFLLFKYSDIYNRPSNYPPLYDHVNSHERLHEFWKRLKGEIEDFQPFDNYKTIGMVIF